MKVSMAERPASVVRSPCAATASPRRIVSIPDSSSNIVRSLASRSCLISIRNFVFGRNAWGEGVGERLQALELPPAWYLVLVPQVAVSTKEIFSDPALTRDTKPLKMSAFFPGQGHNDLQATAVRRHPAIAAHLDWLAAGRPPNAREHVLGVNFLRSHPLREFALAVFNLNAFLHVP